MLGFAQDTDKSGHITWVPGYNVQELLRDAPPEVINLLRGRLGGHLEMFANTLNAILLSGHLVDQALEDLVEALGEVNHRALIRLRQAPPD